MNGITRNSSFRLSMCFWLLLLLSVGGVNAAQVTYLAAAGTIRTYGVDPSTGELTQKQELRLAGAGPLRVSPDGGFLYAVAAAEKRKPALATLKILSDGKLELVATSPVANRPEYLGVDATGTYLAGNHYRKAAITVWAVVDGIAQSGGRQQKLGPKVHAAVFSPDNRWLLVPATGPNKIFVNRFDPATGDAIPNKPASAKAPQGPGTARQPRHLVFHPNGKFAFTSNEREQAGVQTWKWDTESGVLTGLQSIVTQPEGDVGHFTTADVHLTPNGRFLFVSNRHSGGKNSTEDHNAIDTFAVDADTGKLTHVAKTTCERTPRSFCVDATGSYLYVAGQRANALGAYRIQEDGKLTRIANYPTGQGPIWVTCHQLAD